MRYVQDFTVPHRNNLIIEGNTLKLVEARRCPTNNIGESLETRVVQESTILKLEMSKVGCVGQGREKMPGFTANPLELNPEVLQLERRVPQDQCQDGPHYLCAVSTGEETCVSQFEVLDRWEREPKEEGPQHWMTACDFQSADGRVDEFRSTCGGGQPWIFILQYDAEVNELRTLVKDKGDMTHGPRYCQARQLGEGQYHDPGCHHSRHGWIWWASEGEFTQTRAGFEIDTDAMIIYKSSLGE